jgi:Flp pilus assembly protein TadB
MKQSFETLLIASIGAVLTFWAIYIFWPNPLVSGFAAMIAVGCVVWPPRRKERRGR